MSTFFKNPLSLLALALAATSAFASSSPNPSRTVARGAAALNPPISVVKPIGDVIASVATLTNARRFAAGLPPAQPKRRASRIRARDAVPSGTPNTKTGYISVTDGSGSSLGYIASSLNDYGEYGRYTSDLTQALSISFDGSASSNIDLTILNGEIPSLPFFGGIDGFSSTEASLAPGSIDYAVIGATASSATLSAPVSIANSFTLVTGIEESALSGIWNYDATSNIISPQWVNPDSSLPATTLVYVVEEEAYFLTGDVAAFNKNYGVTSVPLTLTFVSA